MRGEKREYGVRERYKGTKAEPEDVGGIKAGMSSAEKERRIREQAKAREKRMQTGGEKEEGKRKVEKK